MSVCVHMYMCTYMSVCVTRRTRGDVTVTVPTVYSVTSSVVGYLNERLHAYVHVHM